MCPVEAGEPHRIALHPRPRLDAAVTLRHLLAECANQCVAGWEGREETVP
jgi:hypothetical protein